VQNPLPAGALLGAPTAESTSIDPDLALLLEKMLAAWPTLIDTQRRALENLINSL